MATSTVILNGTTVMTVNDTTAVATDVGSGKYFYTADGTKTIGSGSGSGTMMSVEGEYAVNNGNTITMGSRNIGYLEVYRTPQLVNNWDFTTSLTDTIEGASVTLGNGAAQSSSGVTISAANQNITTTKAVTGGYTYEVDFGTMTKDFGSVNGRVFMPMADQGLIFRSTGNWQAYMGGAWDAYTCGTDATVLSGKTLRVVVLRIHGYSLDTERSPLMYRFYIDGQRWYYPVLTTGSTNIAGNVLRIGSTGTSFYTMVVTGLRIYRGVYL